MPEYRLLWHDYQYFPYERRLAIREAERLGARVLERDGDGLRISFDGNIDCFRVLTYFKGVASKSHSIVPDQAAAEASALSNGSTWNPGRDQFPSLRRQSTRYSGHGLHEYRGKFNPQIVRAIGNVIGLQPGNAVLDPFCGSGTTLLEASHIGWNALGVDINPLGVLIANAKVAAFRSSPSLLRRESEALLDRVTKADPVIRWQEVLPEATYLQQWFPNSVLQQLAAILKAILQTRSKKLQSVFKIVLSDICREVSLQDPGDLRIRRRKDPADDYPATELFKNALKLKVQTVLQARQHVRPARARVQEALEGDIRMAPAVVQRFLENLGQETFDAAITSPPYATAMPYLDTQRLSLAVFNLIYSRELRSRERELIGNREITERQRLLLEEKILSNSASLPEDVTAFCRHILTLSSCSSHGFRRRNVPALLYKYLVDMSTMFAGVRRVIRERGVYALVVGQNRTTLRGQSIVIDTPSLLCQLAEANGWRVREVAGLDAYHRYDVHQGNSIRDEALLLLEAC